MFDSVGFALEDFSTLRFLQGSAIAHGLGQSMDLIPQLADPKNLYQLIKPAAPKNYCSPSTALQQLAPSAATVAA
jgi:ornithine cyclodeaminase